ncbi:MAG TPA: aldose epimerase [Rariglobus sp.]|jgi:galactose mutarotase-like enzyme|nr:aldose epimerase [Rariglobus sp.]
MEKVPYLGQTLTRWQVGNSTFLAMPEHGARLMNWHLTLGDGSVRDIVYWPELKTLDDFHRVRGGNPVLFPFSARTFDQGEQGFWRDPAGARRSMPQHGFARHSAFKVTRLDARGFSAVLVPGEESKASYPFNYEFSVAYRFAPLGLSCEFTLHNFDTQPIPWSAGHHFYFTAPWSEGLKRSDYVIRIPASKTLRQDTAGRLVAGPTLKPEEPLNNEALVDTFHVGLKGNTVVFGQPGTPSQVAVSNGSAPVPPPDATFVTWAPDADAPYYCVEPWMGPPNAPETKVGLHWVQPGQSQSFAVEIAVK